MISKENLIKKELLKIKNHSIYNGWKNSKGEYGYHSFHLNNINIIGQRNPIQRIEIIKQHIDFTNKNVIDFGCNVGAMLFHLPEIKQGLGIDYDIKCINAANNIKNILERKNLTFKNFDLDNGDYDELKNLIFFKPNIIFILSISHWIKNSIIKLHELSLEISDVIVWEAHEKRIKQKEREFFKQQNVDLIQLTDASYDDTTGYRNRQMYLIKKR